MGLFNKRDSDSSESSSLLDGRIVREDVITAIERLRDRPVQENLETSEQLREMANQKPGVVAEELSSIVDLVEDSFQHDWKGLGRNQSLVWHRILDVFDEVLSTSEDKGVNDERLVRAICYFFDHENESLHKKALQLLSRIENIYADADQRNAIIGLAESEDSDWTNFALSILEAVEAVSDFDVNSFHIYTVVKLAKSDNQEIAAKARSVLAGFAEKRVTQQDDLITILLSIAKSADENIVTGTIAVIDSLAESHIDALVEHVNTILEIVESENETAAVTAVSVLNTMSEVAPEELVDYVDELQTLTPHESVSRLEMAVIVANLAREYPETASSATEILIEATDSDDQELQEQAIRAFVPIASKDPDAVTPHLDALVKLLEHDRATIRKNACEVFGYAGTQEYTEAIRHLRSDELSDVRVTAETTLHRMEQRPATQTETLTTAGSKIDRSQSGTATDELDEIKSLGDLVDDASAFEEIEFVGSGGNGTVNKCRSPHGTIIALKQPRFQGETLNAEVVDKFVREALTWAKLDDHENIVSVHDVGRKPLPWIAMEYVEGGNLNEVIGDVDFETATEIAIGIANSVRHAHRRGVAHLDLKPENILITEAAGEGSPVPKVTDWGLAKMLIDHSQSVEGYTPRYAAPEQFDPETYGAPDDYTDIYQVGTLVYELYTGQVPFEGAPAKIMHAVLNEDPAPPSKVDSSLPAELDNILLRTLEKEKNRRYETFVNFRNNLSDLIG